MLSSRTRALHPDLFIFFFTQPPHPELNPLSLHDALPICDAAQARRDCSIGAKIREVQECVAELHGFSRRRSEEHTSELQSRFDLVCRLLLEKKKKIKYSGVQHGFEDDKDIFELSF